MSTTPEDAKLCHHCGAAGAMRMCGGCGSARYCDKSCQQQGWEAEHRAVCVGKKKTRRGEPDSECEVDDDAPACASGGGGGGGGSGSGGNTTTQRTPAFESSSARAAAKKKTASKKKKKGDDGDSIDGRGGYGKLGTASEYDGYIVHDGGGVAPAAAAIRHCALCGVAESKQLPLKQCVRCKDAAYCSVEHQTEDWKAGHKGQCFKTTATYDDSILARVELMFSEAGGAMTPFDIANHLVGPGYLTSLAAKAGEPMCLVELPGATVLDLSLYPMPSPATLNPNLNLKHEIPYTTHTKGGKTVVVANVNDCPQYGFRMCLNLADKHWAINRYRQCVVLGERMLAVIEPHLLAGQIISRCLELANRGADLSKDDGWRFFDEQVTKFAVFRAQARLIVGRGTRELKNYSAAEKILELGLEEIKKLPVRMQGEENLVDQKNDMQVALGIARRKLGKHVDTTPGETRLLWLYAQEPLDHYLIALAESSLGRVLIDGGNVGAGYEHVRKALLHQRQNFDEVRCAAGAHDGVDGGNGGNGGGDGVPDPRKPWTEIMDSTFGVQLVEPPYGILDEASTGATLAGMLTSAADYENLSPETLDDTNGSGRDRMEKMYLEAIRLARTYGDASKARTAITQLANIYSSCRQLGESADQFTYGDWDEPEQEGWRLKQAALLHSELDEIAALAGRSVETECCICLDTLGGDDAVPVYVIPACYHRLHVECARAQMKTQPIHNPLELFHKVLKCPTCRD